MIAIVLSTVLLIYAATIALLIYGFNNVASFEKIDLKPKTKFSIVVPFRNEADNLPKLLDSLSKLNYPTALFEVILVDDDSEKVFRVPCCGFHIELIKNIRVSNSPKKDAISTAIKVAKNDWIITTDADCLTQKKWLLVIDNYLQNHKVSMIVGAVTYECYELFLHHFQQLDLASLQGATIGSFGLGKGFMCNGANFAYTKSFFHDLDGFKGNDNLASGDDVFLLQKAMKKYPSKVHYLKSKQNIVITKPMENWKSLFFQRLRWASKTASYESRFGKGLALVVFGANLSWVLCFVLWPLGLVSLQLIVVLFFFKFVFDAFLIYKANAFLTKNKIRYLILSSLVYPFFSVSVALYSLFGKYEWKGRQF